MQPVASGSRNVLHGRSSPRQGSSSRSAFTHQTPNRAPYTGGNPGGENPRSHTWTSSSEDPDLLSDEDKKDDRGAFVQEYNRLAQKHGIRPVVPGDFLPKAGRANESPSSRRNSWFSKILRQTPEPSEPACTKPEETPLRRQRSLSDAALHLIYNHKQDGLKNQDLRDLIRLCGKSSLFLPAEYAPFSLTLPTCLRALAQALVQHSEIPGLFRISGSLRAMNALYDYYCTDDKTSTISSTTRCPTLPAHIRCNAHDMASTFKRFLSGLPGGILGSLSLFDALVAIHSQLQGSAELHRTKESKLRARLIALAIGTVESQYRRELICAVFGLLCLVGRVAENAPREDERGRPLPVDGLMGYNALGIVFGPLLIGDLIDDYSTMVADPTAGLVLLPVSPPGSKKERHKQKQKHKSKQKQAKSYPPKMNPPFAVNKIHIANKITEMVIVHWREVVRQIRSTGSVKPKRNTSSSQNLDSVLRRVPSSASESFSFRNLSPQDHDHPENVTASLTDPRPPLDTKQWTQMNTEGNMAGQRTTRRGQTVASGSGPIRRQSLRETTHLLSPTIEESPPLRIEAPKPVRYVNDIYNMTNNLTQNAHTTYSKPRAKCIRGSGSAEGIDRIESFRNELAQYMETDIPNGVYSLEAPKPDISSVSSSLGKKYPNSCALNFNIPTSDSHRMEGMATKKLAPSLSPIRSSILHAVRPKSQEVSSCDNELRASDIHVLQQITPESDRLGTTYLNSNSAAIENERPSYLGIDKLTATLRKTSTGLPPNYTRVDQDPNDEYGSTQGTKSQLGETSHPIPADPVTPRHAHSIFQDRPSCGTEGVATTPADQWRRLVASSKSSTESLRRLAKERRLKRSSIHGLSQSSQVAPTLADPKLAMLTWKRQSMQDESGSTEKSTTKQLEKRNMLRETLQLSSSASSNQIHSFSSRKYPTASPLRGPRRSPSKPVPGAVKAMAALFNNTANGALSNSAVPASKRFRRNVRSSNDCHIGSQAVEESPTKHRPVKGSPVILMSPGKPNRSPRRIGPNGSSVANTDYSPSHASITIQLTPSRAVPKNSPISTPRSSLNPMDALSSPVRVRPQSSPKSPVDEVTNHSLPPRPNPIARYSEEEQSARSLARPRSETPSTAAHEDQSHDRNHNCSDLSIQADVMPSPLFSQPTSRQTSGSRSRSIPTPISISSLEAQIRDLRRQLEARDDEIANLRRQNQDQIRMADAETPCEQHLRAAKRECLAWRRRAKIAETRVAMLQRLGGGRFTGLSDGVDDGGGLAQHTSGKEDGEGEKRKRVCEIPLSEDEAEGSSGYTEDQEAFRDRSRRDFVGRRAIIDSDVFDEGLGEDEGDSVKSGVDDELCDDRPIETTRLWEDVEEMLNLRRGAEPLDREG